MRPLPQAIEPRPLFDSVTIALVVIAAIAVVCLIPLFLAATASVANFYMVCQRELYPQSWTERLRYLPILMSIGIGLAVNNTKAVLEAIFHKPSEFKRTPKYRIEGGGDCFGGCGIDR